MVRSLRLYRSGGIWECQNTSEYDNMCVELSWESWGIERAGASD